MPLNRDTIASLCLIMACGGLMFVSLDIREPDYGVLSPATWPRLIIVIMAILSTIYFVQSIRLPRSKTPVAPRLSFTEFVLYWRNVLIVFFVFAIYLMVLPYLGMLVGNILFSLVLLTALGGFKPFIMHIMVAFGTSGGMWLLFIYGLDVILPRGSLTGF